MRVQRSEKIDDTKHMISQSTTTAWCPVHTQAHPLSSTALFKRLPFLGKPVFIFFFERLGTKLKYDVKNRDQICSLTLYIFF